MRYWMILIFVVVIVIGAALLRTSRACTSTIISYDNKTCFYLPLTCPSHHCEQAGEPCSYCSESVPLAWCTAATGKRCLELKDCDGCGLEMTGLCAFQNGAWVCVPTAEGPDCLRTWCSEIEPGPGG